MSSTPAGFESGKNVLMVAAIAIHKKTITISPASGDWNPKNAIDQKVLSINWIPKIASAILTCGLSKPRRHTRNNEMPINVYNVNQTGAKSQLGGVKKGLLSVTYQVWIDALVETAPIRAAR